jgi:type VI secretion system protein ImpH
LLFDEPYRFGFFQAVRLLERLYPERLPVGRARQPDGRVTEPAREVVRFRTPATLNFPPSEVHELGRDGNAAPDDPLRMTVAFMGLTGPSGVLPAPYTELLMERTRQLPERARAKGTALQAFFDLFGHRAISLFFRAWEKYRFAVAFERENLACRIRAQEDRFTEYLFDLIGLGTRGLRGRLELPDQGLLRYAGMIAQRPHSASALGEILGDYFAAPARIAQFTGQWLTLEANDLTRLGRANSRLGQSTIAGTRVWDTQSRFRLRFGPLPFKQFVEFLPNGSAFKPAIKLTRFLAGQEFDFDLQLVLKREEVPGTVLTTRARRKPMLGWTTWLKTRPAAADDSQVALAVRD